MSTANFANGLDGYIHAKDYNLTAQAIITRAFQILNIYPIGKAPSANDFNFAMDQLNSMVKHWQADGLRLWNRQEAYLFTVPGTSNYSLSNPVTSPPTAPTTSAGTPNPFATRFLTTAGITGATTLTIGSYPEIHAPQIVGIRMDDKTRFFTTLQTVISPTSFTIIDPLPSPAALGANVTFGSIFTQSVRPLRITSARIRNMSNGIDIPITMMRYEEYQDISIKSTPGQPTGMMYDKQLGYGTIYLWPTPDDANYVVNFTYYDTVEDFDSPTNDPDFPQEWLLALQWGLAALLAIPYGQITKQEVVGQMAAAMKAELESFDTEDESILISPNNTENIRTGRY